jgi:5-dehydro-2-deoxygluconokinase
VWEATRASGHELLLEIIVPAPLLAPDDVGQTVVRSVQRLYDLGLKPEWWKLPPMAAAQWQALDALVQQRDAWCRGAVILGLSQPLEQLVASFHAARASIVKGFMVGRSCWNEPSAAWLRGHIDDAGFQAQVAANFRQLIAGWRASRVEGTP